MISSVGADKFVPTLVSYFLNLMAVTRSMGTRLIKVSRLKLIATIDISHTPMGSLVVW